jgi:alkaline phosphatase
MRLRHAPAARRLMGLLLATALILGLFSPGLAATPPVKNVIMLIPDGCAAEQYTLARWAKGQPLAQDAIMVGGVRTYIADSVVADSAPAATAYATGLRTADKLIGVGPPPQGLLPGQPAPGELTWRPLATVLEAARVLGKSTGLVATSRITHATPAAFAAHVSHRDQENAVAKQMAHQGLTVFLGGGRRHFMPEAGGGQRQDGLDLLAQLRRQGYQTPQTREELLAVKGGRVAGLFAASHLKSDRERAELAPGEPSLAEMTAKALEVLAQNPRGFFLMVEGSQIDWACHANDPGHLVGDLLAYDRAVQVALDFARRDGHTLLLAMSDHNTGGMSIGNYATSKTYTQMSPQALLEPLSKMRLPSRSLWERLGQEVTPQRIQEAVQQWWGMEISPEEARQIMNVAARYPKDPEYGLGEVLSASHTLVGWATHGHSGGDVPLFAFGPGRPSGLLEAPQVGLAVAAALGADLRQLDQRLHAPATQSLPGAVLSEEKTASGWLLTVEAAGRAATMADGANILRLGGQEIELESPVVRVEETGQWYLPRQAAQLILGSTGKDRPQR